MNNSIQPNINPNMGMQNGNAIVPPVQPAQPVAQPQVSAQPVQPAQVQQPVQPAVNVVQPQAPVAPAQPAAQPQEVQKKSTKIVLNEDPIIKPIEPSNVSPLSFITKSATAEQTKQEQELPKEQSGSITF